MEFMDFGAVLSQMDPNAVFKIVNEARPPADYVFAKYLPEEQKTGFDVKGGSLRVVSTMAGLVGKDSPYPPAGVVDTRTFIEETAKLALQARLSEEAQIELYEILLRMNASRQPTTEFMVRTVLNFANKVLGQGQLDTMEWLRGQALTNFEIDWEYGDQDLKVDYQINKSKYMLPKRTGNGGYGGSESKFWADIMSAQQKLRYDVVEYLAHPNTINMIIGNDANALRVLSQDNGTFSVVQQKTAVNGGVTDNSDVRYKVTLSAYGGEGEIIDPSNPKKTIKIPFLEEGKILVIGGGRRRGFQIGDAAPGIGSTPDDGATRLGYTHIAPTAEGKFRLGRWADIFTPEREPWALEGRSVTRGLPVIEADDRLVVLSTDMV